MPGVRKKKTFLCHSSVPGRSMICGSLFFFQCFSMLSLNHGFCLFVLFSLCVCVCVGGSERPIKRSVNLLFGEIKEGAQRHPAGSFVMRCVPRLHKLDAWFLV